MGGMRREGWRREREAVDVEREGGKKRQKEGKAREREGKQRRGKRARAHATRNHNQSEYTHTRICEQRHPLFPIFCARAPSPLLKRHDTESRRVDQRPHTDGLFLHPKAPDPLAHPLSVAGINARATAAAHSTAPLFGPCRARPGNGGGGWRRWWRWW